MPVSPPTDTDEGALEGLSRALEKAKGGDSLAPVTVVTPSTYASVFVRRALGARWGAAGGRGWANIRCTTVPGVLRLLGEPPLAARGRRLAPSAVDLEVIRRRSGATPGWLAHFSSHPAAPVELQRALDELRRCPPATLEAIGRHPGRGSDLVGLLAAVRRDLHDGGFADSSDLANEALGAARERARVAQGIGALVPWRLGPVPPVERAVLELLGGIDTDEGPSTHRATTLTELRACADPDEEARSTVRSIVASAEAGVPLWQQAVFHPPGPTYARILHQHLTGSGIPSHGPGLHRLHRSMTGRTLLDLLELAGGAWPRREVHRWLSSAPITAGPGGRPVPSSRWDVLSAAAGVVRGPEQWHDRLGHFATRHGGPEAEGAAELAAFVDELFARATPAGTSWASFATWAVVLLDYYLPPDGDQDRWPDHEVAAAGQVRAAVTALGDLDRVSGGADLVSFRRAVRAQLERTVLDLQELLVGGVGDGVFLAPYSAARGLQLHSVVVTGLADALVAGSGTGAGLLGNDVSALDTSGTLTSPRDHRDAAREELWCAVAAGAGERIGTRPRGDPRTGRAQVPSRWLPDLIDTETRHREVDSFAAGLADARPVISAREFELHQLDRWVRTGGDPAASPAAHDERLARGFEAARRRTEPGFTRFDGYVGRGQVSAYDPGTPVSATRFETYAKCPRRFLFDRVLRVSPRILPEELWRIEPITRGSLVHAILEEYVAERVDGAPRSLDRLLSVAASSLDAAEGGGLVGKRLLWRMDRAAIVRDLIRFHVEEGDIDPIAAELSFGGGVDDDGPPVSVVLDHGRSVAFQGSVDRVDRTAAGQLMVSDYKTGRQRHLGDLIRDPVAGGQLLQLPLYAMAALDRFGGPRPVHARYWLLSGERSAPCFHLVVTDSVETRFRQVVRLIADGVEDGCFPGIPGAPSHGRFANCATCDFDRVCPTSRDREWSRAYNSPALRGVVTLVNRDLPDGLTGSVVKRFVDPDGGTAS